MNFDNEIFKEYYGKPYIVCIKADLVICLLSVGILSTVYLLELPFRQQVGTVLLPVLVAGMFPILPLLIYLYVKAKRRSQLQRIHVVNDMLVVDMLPRDELLFHRYPTNFLHYEAKNVSMISPKRRFVEVTGDITLTETNGDDVTTSQWNSMFIPITFRNFCKLDQKPWINMNKERPYCVINGPENMQLRFFTA